MLEALLSNFQGTFVFIIVLSILIVVHEWGHFITAKKLGVKVEEFSLGFGPKLFSKLHNGTEYMLKLIPLGGYVRMAGDERSRTHGQPDEFLSKPVGQRSLIVLNGPVVNFILAYLCFALVFLIGYPAAPTLINKVKSSSPAAKAGIQEGDHIVSINGKKVYGQLHLERLLEGSSQDTLNLIIQRDGNELPVQVIPDIVMEPDFFHQSRQKKDIGVSFTSNEIGWISEDSPAQKNDLKVGDRIIQVDGVNTFDWEDVRENIADSSGDEIRIVLLRDGEQIEKRLIPEIIMVKDEDGVEKGVRKIGIAQGQDTELFRFDPLTSVRYAYDELAYITVMTYKAMYYMITGKTSPKESVGGPVLIFGVVKSAAERGISHLLLILGVVSASLAIFNLMPIIPLDGGHIFLFGIEKLRGRPLSEKTEDWISRIGLSFIILLALYIFYIDFERVGLFQWIQQSVESLKQMSLKIFN
ncbi:MAG: RIP metalloprotease RseP [Candidatus Omnitrophica bacterium]|nr:RIP metalloprotease RseP [Candidatus Omnitrophota bacterium]MCB9746881.1 RIP metalloprotease RseP [Candidatus Omnitrophota bacterium]